MKRNINYLKKYLIISCCLLLAFQFTNAQLSIVKGRIVTYDNKPAYSVNVELKELKKITASNDEGYYEFKNIKPGIYTIVVSFVGLVTQQKTIDISTGSADVHQGIRITSRQRTVAGNEQLHGAVG